MKFKRGHSRSSVPEVNLVPMMDVLMTVLTFFIIISMTLTIERGVNLELPSAANQSPQQGQPTPLVVKIDSQGQVLLNDQLSSKDLLAAQVRGYITENPQGFVVLSASPDMPYEQVVQMLSDMKAIGGDRVSLAIE